MTELQRILEKQILEQYGFLVPGREVKEVQGGRAATQVPDDGDISAPRSWLTSDDAPPSDTGPVVNSMPEIPNWLLDPAGAVEQVVAEGGTRSGDRNIRRIEISLCEYASLESAARDAVIISKKSGIDGVKVFSEIGTIDDASVVERREKFARRIKLAQLITGRKAVHLPNDDQLIIVYCKPGGQKEGWVVRMGLHDDRRMHQVAVMYDNRQCYIEMRADGVNTGADRDVGEVVAGVKEMLENIKDSWRRVG
jgi:hypothetical protein